MPTWDDVVAIGLRFPGVELATSYGTPALKVRGKGMCRLRTDPDAWNQPASAGPGVRFSIRGPWWLHGNHRRPTFARDPTAPI